MNGQQLGNKMLHRLQPQHMRYLRGDVLQQMPPVVLWPGDSKQLLLNLLSDGKVALACCVDKLLHELEEAPPTLGSQVQRHGAVQAAAERVLQN